MIFYFAPEVLHTFRCAQNELALSQGRNILKVKFLLVSIFIIFVLLRVVQFEWFLFLEMEFIIYNGFKSPGRMIKDDI